MLFTVANESLAKRLLYDRSAGVFTGIIFEVLHMGEEGTCYADVGWTVAHNVISRSHSERRNLCGVVCRIRM